MWELVESIENSGFATFVRETPSVLGYSTVLALHTFGMAFLVGLSGAIALRVLGIAPSLPLAPLEKFFPLIVIGFWVNAVTGLILTTLAARSFLRNPDFFIKLTAIACAIVCLRRLKRDAFGDRAHSDAGPAPEQGKAWATAMLLFWGIAILAGRLTAYSTFVRKQTAIAVVIATLLLFAARYAVLAVARSAGLLSVDRRTPHPGVTTPTHS
jgi:hypothetical protein